MGVRVPPSAPLGQDDGVHQEDDPEDTALTGWAYVTEPRRATGTIIFIAAVALPVAHWWTVTGVPRWTLALASLVGLALFLALAVAVLRRVLVDTHHPLWRSVIVVSCTSAAVTAASWAGVATTSTPPVALLAVGSVAAAIGVSLIRHHEGLWGAWLIGAPATLLLVGGVWALVPGTPPLGELVWSTSDQTALANMTRLLLEFGFAPFYYMAGSSVVLAPAAFGVGAWNIPDAQVLANILNLLMLPSTVAVVVPVALGLCGRAVVGPGRRATTATTAAIGAVLLAYAILPPDFVLERNAELVPLRLSGLVFGPEIVGLLFVAVAVAVLADPSRPWSPVLVGSLTGLAAISTERNLLLVLPFALLLLTVPGQRARIARAGAVAVAVVLPQLLYFRLRYDSWIFPNRHQPWAEERADRAVSLYSENYDFPIEGRPLDTAYLSTNLPATLAGNWWLLGLLVLGVAIAWSLDPRRWRLWAFCLGVSTALVLLSAAFINIVVSWRYNFLVAPLAAVPALAAVSMTWSRVVVRSTELEEPRESDDDIVELAAEPVSRSTAAAGR